MLTHPQFLVKQSLLKLGNGRSELHRVQTAIDPGLHLLISYYFVAAFSFGTA